MLGTDKRVNKVKSDKTGSQEYFNNLIFPVIAVIFGLVAGGIFMVIIGKNPFKAYQVLINSSFGSLRGFSEMLVNTTPLIFTGLSVAFAFRTGLFNIGGEGQFLVAYTATAWVGYALSLPWFIHVPLALIAGIIAGGLWGGIAGYLKAKMGVHEVITTIMLNYIGFHYVGFLLGKKLKDPSVALPATPVIKETAQLHKLLPPRLNTSILLALIAAVLVYYILWKTTIGYEIRAVGLNPEASRYGGINVGKSMVLAMFISGALAGLAGSTQVMGLEPRAYQPFGFLGYGFTGIAVALLGKNHPAGVVLGALLFGVLARGSNQMQSLAGVPKEVIEVIQAIIILFVAAEYAFKLLAQKTSQKGVGAGD
ncbi:ABC transporter permease [Halothermothrix orenii]|uniref:Inner-membrane translocator n=1 Tax=Halothermothrix orenii (strain H 168 / OCM 544 / DSM 9562) TaxID=373903 RepID=B8CWG6_HALOH|nr:ABC transporter permease [Halothermothrix orenii]ACL69635.1 inner-membrane translocator [Halothermothrix orenii H 168]